MKTELHTKDTFSSNRTLESVIWVSAIVLFFILFSYSSANANSTDFNKKSTTGNISLKSELNIKPASTIYNFEEETYIDDIPFEIIYIEQQINYDNALSIEFNFEEEQFINDSIIQE